MLATKCAKNLLHNPHPPSSKRLIDVEVVKDDPVFRERSANYGILYIVRSSPDEVLIFDIGHRKEIYRMAKTKTEPANDMSIIEADFDDVMAKALGTAPPEGDKPKWLSSYPCKKKG